MSAQVLFRILVYLAFFAWTINFTFAQNVGINNPNPAASALLDLTSANKGLLIPRVALNAANLAAPVASPDTSLLVYNTATAGTPPNQVNPGFYYWNGTRWMRFNETGEGWSTTGNAGTITGTNFLGTTDFSPLMIKVNNERAGLLEGAPGGLTLLGHHAGLNAPWFSENTMIGSEAGKNTLGSSRSVFVGSGAGKSVSGEGNVAIGYMSDTTSWPKNYNTVVGYKAGSYIQADGMSLFGAEAGRWSGLGRNNSYFGFWAGRQLDGSNNALFGDSVMIQSNVGSDGNSIFGSKAGTNLSQSAGNSIVGHSAASTLFSGVSNAVFGEHAADYYYSGSYNSIFGAEAGGGHNWGNVNNDGNALFGYRAGRELEQGGHSIFGTEAGYLSREGQANSYFGRRAGYNNLDGSNNSFFGDSAGYNVGYSYTMSDRNAFFGAKSGNWLNDAMDNVMVGYKSGGLLQDGDYNTLVGSEANGSGASFQLDFVTAIGYRAGMTNTISQNSFIGSQAGMNNQSGEDNTYIGFRAGVSIQGDDNTFVGDSTGAKLFTGDQNTFLGSKAGGTMDSGSENVGVGYRALYGISTFNTINGTTALGVRAGENPIGSVIGGVYVGYMSGHTGNGTDNCFIGGLAGQTYGGIQNVAVGTAAGNSLNSSNRNVLMGYHSGYSMNNSEDNVVIGYQAGSSASGIDKNVLIGRSAGQFLSFGDEGNVIIGDHQGFSSHAGNNHTLVGRESHAQGSNFGTAFGAWAVATGAGGTAIGPLAQAYANASALGAYAYAPNANTVVLGGVNGVNGSPYTANVGIGTVAPAERLHVVGSIRMVDGSQAAGRVMTSNASGTASWTDPGTIFNGWSTTGNAGTNTTTNFIGTTDNNGIAFRTNNIERMRIYNTGIVGIGTTAPTRKLHVVNNGGSGGGVPHGNSMFVLENNTSLYQHMLHPSGSESGFLWGSPGTSIRGGIVFNNIAQGLVFRTGGNTTRMALTNLGRLGLGTTAPTATLDVRGNAVFNELGGNFDFRVESDLLNYMFWIDASANNVKIGTSALSSMLLRVGQTTGAGIHIGSVETIADAGGNLLETNSTFIPSTDNNRNLGSPTRRWNQVWAGVGVIQTSDGRDKEHVRDLEYGIAEVMKLRPVKFNWKSQPYEGDKIGLIAQEIETVISEVVQKHEWVQEEEGSDNMIRKETDRYGVYYSDLIPVLVKALQEQQEEIEGLKARLEEIENR